MLRYMRGAFLQSTMTRASITQALLAGAATADDQIPIAAAMAEIDGIGKSLSHDYALSRPTPCHIAEPLRLSIYPHPLVCIGGFLANYKRRFIIQNPLGIDLPTKLELHRELIYGDTTDE